MALRAVRLTFDWDEPLPSRPRLEVRSTGPYLNYRLRQVHCRGILIENEATDCYSIDMPESTPASDTSSFDRYGTLWHQYWNL